MRLGRWVTTVALLASAVSVASAQSTGGLRIRVIDNSDKTPAIGAAVTLSNTNQLVATTTIMVNNDGVALFPVLRAGKGYVIDVVLDGYARIKQEASVSIGSESVIVISLAPEQVERVVVTGQKTQVDLDNAEASTKFSSEFIQDLPVAGRFYQNVLSLAPGVSDDDGDGNPNVHGSRERDFKTSVGGVSNVDPLTGEFLNLVSSDSIEDLTVITAGAGAEYGRAQGGYANIIQKQGSNDFEGVFGMLYRSSKLDGNGATNIPNSQLPDFYLYQPSLQVSGPIVKDKLWYRLSQEVIKAEDPLVLANGSKVATSGSKRFSTDNQLTWQVSNRNKLAFNFRADPVTETNQGISATVPVESSQTIERGGPTYSLTWTAPYSPSLFMESSVFYQDSKFDILPTTTGVDNECVNALSPLAGALCFDAVTGLVTGSNPVNWHDSRQRMTVKADATYYKGRLWGANHQFKFGMIVENERYFRTLERDPNFLRAFGFDEGTDSVKPVYTVTAALEPTSQQRAVGTTWGVYGEDVIKPLANLTITVGLRIEQEDISAPGFAPFDPQAEADAYAEATKNLDESQSRTILRETFTVFEDIEGSITSVASQLPGYEFSGTNYLGELFAFTHWRKPQDINLHNTNIAPRFSIAWDPWNDGKTSFSISAGRYYDKIFLAVPAAENESVLTTFDVPEAPRAAPFDPTFGYSTVSRDLQTPRTDEYSIAFQREIFQESSISLRYIHKDAKLQLQDININQVPGDYGRCLVQLDPQLPYIEDSPGTGELIDPYTNEPYLDTDPGDGDGRLDDCSGDTFRAPAEPPDPDDPGGGPGTPGSDVIVTIPDGVPDQYILNPAWGDIFQIGNYNSAKYDGVVLEFVRRQYKNWQMEASYTWSRATGDGEDFDLLLGDDRSTLQDEKGYQSYDRRHAVKLNATTITPWGFRLGGAVLWQSGLPYSLLERKVSESVPVPGYPADVSRDFTSVRTQYITHQRNDQRNRSYWNVDAKFVKEMNLPKGMNLQMTAEVFNLLNEDTYIVYNTFTESGQQINGTNDGGRFFGRRYQVGVRLAF